MDAPSDLNVRLGHDADAKLLIINGDDYGMCRSATVAVSELLGEGLLDSATVMMPCAWAPAAIARAQAGWDVGVHLVLTSEWVDYRWRPLTGAASLCDEAGYFPPDCLSVEKNAAEADVAAELRAQLASALALGLDVSHMDNHMGSVYGVETGRHFLAQVLPLCAEFALPFRLPRRAGGMVDPSLQPALDMAGQIADSLGVVLPDHLWTHPFELVGEGTDQAETYESMRAGFLDLMAAVHPGVTEFFVHPMYHDTELADVATFAAPKREWEARLLRDPVVRACFADLGITRIGWRDLRALQRGEA